MSKSYVGSISSTIKIGTRNVLKAYKGSVTIYNPISVPDSPTNVVATLSGKDASISFSIPTNDGGSSITNYLVQYSSNNGSSWTSFAGIRLTSPITVNALSYNKSYIFRVVAVNDIGNSIPSNSSNGVTTPPGVPGYLYGQFRRGGRPNDSEMLSGNILSTPLSSPSLYSSINYGENDDEYGFIAIGYFIPPTNGTYTFYTSSDDGSAVWVGSIAEASTGRSSSNMVVNNNVTGYQGDTERSGSIVLTAGTVYAIRIIHREGDGGDNLRFSWAGPGISKTTSLASYFYANNFGSEPPSILSLTVESYNSYLRIYPVVAPAASYLTIQYSSNNGVSWTTFGDGQTAYSASIDVTGLINDTSYILKITATNSIGTGEEYITSSYSPNPNSVSPLHLANGFLSTVRNDTINPADFPNAVVGNGYISVLRNNPLTAAELPPKIGIGNGYLSILRIGDTINPSDFPNAAIGNGYISVLRVSDTINPGDFPNAAIGNGYIGVLYSDTI